MDKSRRTFLKSGLTGGAVSIVFPLWRFFSAKGHLPSRDTHYCNTLSKEYRDKLFEVLSHYGGEFSGVNSIKEK